MEWCATQVEARGGEAALLRPRLVVGTFRQLTMRGLDLRREAASASELREAMEAESGFYVPQIDWNRSARRVMTLEWIDGIKLTNRQALIEAGHDLKELAAILVRALPSQGVCGGFFPQEQERRVRKEGGWQRRYRWELVLRKKKEER